MFSDEILEKIFAHPEASKVPIGCQSTMIHVIEEVLEDVENVARGDATGKDLSQKTEEPSASEKPADTIEQSEDVAKENKDEVKKSGIYLDKSGITKNSDGSYSFSESYIEDVKKIQGMEKYNDQEINEILNGIGEFIIKYSDNIAQSFIEKEMIKGEGNR